MPIPPAEQLRAATRGLHSTQRDGATMAVLTAERAFAAPVEEVWDALTNPERIPRWIAPIEGDLRVGGHYQLTKQAGGTILACDSPRSLSITWEFGGEISWVDVELTQDASADGASTLLTLQHTAPVDPAKWAQYGPGAVGIGWEMMLMGIDEHLAHPDADPREVQEWMSGPEGLAYLGEFTVLSSEQWIETSIAYGTDPDEARAAGARCTAAYLGLPEPGSEQGSTPGSEGGSEQASEPGPVASAEQASD